MFRANFCPKHVELILEINKTVIVASRWFLYYLTLLLLIYNGNNPGTSYAQVGQGKLKKRDYVLPKLYLPTSL